MASILLFTRPEFESTENRVVVDLSQSIRISEFLAASQSWLLIALIFAVFVGLLQDNTVTIRVTVPTLTACLLAISWIRRHPNRDALLAWSGLLILTAAPMAVWCLLHFILRLIKDFSIPLLAAVGDVLLFYLVCWRVLNRDAGVAEDPADDSGFVVLRASTSSTEAERSLFDVWFSGGWRSTLVIVALWVMATVIIGAKAILTCAYLALGLGCIFIIHWILLPVRDVALNDSAVGIVESIAQNRITGAQHGRYLWFVLRRALAYPAALVRLTLSLLSAVAALLCFASTSFVDPFRFDLSILTPIASTAGWSLLGVSLLFFRLGARHATRKPLEEDVSSSEPFTLYLRSFGDDDIEVLRDSLFFRIWMTDPWFDVFRKVRFEQVITAAVWPFGKCIALDRPGETLPQLGALRIGPSTEDWQLRIRNLISRSTGVLMSVGFTSGLKWEFQRLEESGDLDKVSLVLLQDSIQSSLSTWRDFVAHSPLLLSCPDEVLARSLAVRFRPDDHKPVFLIAERASVAAYDLALNACWLPFEELLQVHSESHYISPSRIKFAGWVAIFLMTIALPLSWEVLDSRRPTEKAREKLEFGIEAGDPAEMLTLGNAYLTDSPPNYRRARMWMARASRAGSPQAMNNLGYIYEHGLGVNQDYAKARLWYSRSAQFGGEAAIEHLQSLAHRDGQLALEKAASAGDVDGMVGLANRYLRGSEGPPDYLEARRWYEQAAASGSETAMLALAIMYANGLGGPPDFQQAAQWYLKAASGGSSDAMVNLGYMFANGKGVPKNYGKAWQWWQRAAETGDPTAMYDLGTLCENGQGGARNFEQARQWYERAAATGKQLALEVAVADASRWYESTAARGGIDSAQSALAEPRYEDVAARAMDRLGHMYSDGLWVQPNYRKAAAWFKESADEAYAPAMVSLAGLYRRGQGVAKDPDVALELYEKAFHRYELAAESGDAAAMLALGKLYENGLGVPRDPGQAKDWYRQAAEAGNSEASQLIR
jgi:TPR repeat protein